MVFEDNKEYGQCQKPYTAQHLLSLLHVHAEHAKYYQGTVDYQRMDLLRIRSMLSRIVDCVTEVRDSNLNGGTNVQR